MFKCNICSKEFNNWDELASTTCGHVFHMHCLHAWMNCSDQCPQCPSQIAGSHQIFLNFDEAQRQTVSADESHAIEVSRLESQLEQNEKNCCELQEKLEHIGAQHESLKQANILKSTEVHNLHAQLESLQERTRALQKSLDDRESYMISNITQHERIEQANMLKSTELIMKLKTLEEKLLLITTENEKLHKALDERDRQISSNVGKIDDLTKKVHLLSEPSSRQRHTAQSSPLECRDTDQLQIQKEYTELKQRLTCEFQEKIMLSEQKNTLEEKLEQIQLELQREIRRSTQISVDRMRLVSMMEKTTVSGDVARNQDTYQQVVRNKVPENEGDIIASTTTAKPVSNGVVILGLNGNFAPRETVLKLAQQMLVCIDADDIDNVMVNRQYKNDSLIVGFKTKASKDIFLAQAAKLKYYPETQRIEVADYCPPAALLTYAKKLKSVGYKNVYINKDFVFARVDKKSTPITIFNKEAVDKLMKLPTTSLTLPKHNDCPKAHEQPSLHWSNANDAFEWDNRYCIPTFTT